ncbi:3'-5' exoribonuclease HELZ2-like isoform X2 [Clavelina lepadiformis]|uniref:3'-5' exoribonuclease HELZ2-like isoform X2 n=1 Tax=Clavelina lepadiformis TaxID=159417 RepID=UPI00404308DE
MDFKKTKRKLAGLFTLSDDPNEPDEDVIPWDQTEVTASIYKKYSIKKLEQMLNDEPDRYKKCRLERLEHFLGTAVILTYGGAEYGKKIEVSTKRNLGRSFNGDIVVVEITARSKPSTSHGESKLAGRVLGVLERKEDIYSKIFICRLDEFMRMVPIDENYVKFYIKHPYYQIKAKKVHFYKRSQLRKSTDNEIGLELKHSKPVDLHASHHQEADLYSVRYMKWSCNRFYPFGYVEGKFAAGKLTIFDVRYRAPGCHRNEITNEAKKQIAALKIKKIISITKKRDDLTNLFTFTIDGENTRTYDDGFSVDECKGHENCWKVGIHVTDVTSFVPEDSELDKEAEKRASSFLGNNTDKGKMLPQPINEECSLISGKERSAVSFFLHSSQPPLCIYSSYDMDVTEEAEYKSLKPQLTKIQMKKNLTFSEAQNYLNKEMDFLYEANDLIVNAHLYQKMDKLWTIMWELRVLRLGAAAFYKEPEDGVNDWHNVCMAQILVEEAMITYNSCMAYYMKNSDESFIGRALKEPNPADVEIWNPSVLSLYQISFYEFINSQRRNEIKKTSLETTMPVSSEVWEIIEDALNNDKVETAVLLACCDDKQPMLIPGLNRFKAITQIAECRSMNRDDNTTHFLLRVKAYAHCSSPLRRYADIVNQRIVVGLLCSRKVEDKNSYHVPEDIAKKVHELSQREENAINYERALRCFHSEKTFSAKFCEGFLTKIDDVLFSVTFPSLSRTYRISAANIALFQTNNTKFIWKFRSYHHGGRKHYMNFGGGIAIATNKWKGLLSLLECDLLLQRKRSDVKNTLLDIIANVEHMPVNSTAAQSTLNHFFKLEIDIKLQPLHFQLSRGVEWGIPTLVPQLVHLNDQFDVCLQHRRHVDVFEIHRPAEKKLKFKNMKLKYYHDHWVSLVRLDGQYSAVHTLNSIYLNSVDVALEVKNDQIMGCFMLEKIFCQERFIYFHEGDLLCLREQQSSSGNVWIAHAVINEVKNDFSTTKVTFTVSKYHTNGLPPPPHPQQMMCEIISLDISHRRMIKALHSLHNPDQSALIEDICLNTLTQEHMKSDIRVDRVINSIGKTRLEALNVDLNEEQIKNIKVALKNRLTIIQGPPGTGKSLMGAHLAYYFCKINKVMMRKTKLLYCGPSNKSVDVVAEYLMKTKSLKIVRVYGNILEELDFPIPNKPKLFGLSENPTDPKLRPFALHHIIREEGKPFAEKLQHFNQTFAEAMVDPNKADCIKLQTYQEYDKLLKEAKEAELKDKDIVLCTCIAAGGPLLSGLTYAQCIIDECGMCSEPECLVPLVAAAKTEEHLQVTLIGDHKQLQPIVICHEAKRGGLDKSLFEKLSEHALKLTRQYRMHPGICEFPSKEFYGGELITDQSVEQRSVVVDPIKFYHVNGEEEEDSSKSKFNTKEAELVAILTEKFLKKFQAKDIMILTPYLAQCSKIREIIKKKLGVMGHKIHVGTVVTSQGSEADYILLSMVRSNQMLPLEEDPETAWVFRNIGFVSDDHQINVAITRARLALRIVGNKDLLCKHPTWKHLVTHYRKEKAVEECK